MHLNCNFTPIDIPTAHANAANAFGISLNIHRLAKNALATDCFYSNTIEYRSASRIVNLSTTGLPIREATLGFPFQLTR